LDAEYVSFVLNMELGGPFSG